MSLAAGMRLGPYEILAPAGAGGMGEVYRAKDTRLGRTVAIKVLPSELAQHPDLCERFEQEARSVSRLAHPHICTLHDVGHHGGVDFLVFEYLEGETLEHRLKKGPLRVEDAIHYATEIADALDKAHREGIIHRDLKPGNIMLTKSGAKLLDFGLAKLRPEPPLEAREITVDTRKLTAEGTLLGTLPYMAPEEFEGKPADARSDIFALGAVIYEMITQRQAFSGKSKASLVAAILSSVPPAISSLQPLSPPLLDRVVHSCLEKDPELRWQNAYDLKLELMSLADQTAQLEVRTRRGAWAFAAILAGVLGLIAGIALYALLFTRPAPTADFRFTLTPPEKGSYDTFAVSPDGKRIAFSSAGALWVRSLNALAPQRLVDVQSFGSVPFWSPDGKWIGFFSDGKLNKIQSTGGPPETVCSAPQPSGGTWNGDDIILFNPDIFHADKAGIFRVSARGGEPTPVTRVDSSHREVAHVYPQFLPDGRHFLYLAGIGSGHHESRAIYVGSLDGSRPVRILTSDSNAIYDRGYLLFLRHRTLLAQQFDVNRLQARGEPVALAPKIPYFEPVGAASFSVAAGVLAYISEPGSPFRLAWFNRAGKEISSVSSPGDYSALALSPDEKRIVTERLDNQASIGALWVLDVARNTSSRITFNPSWEYYPVWSPDGRRILFASNREQARGGSPGNLYITAADGSGLEEPLARSDAWKWPNDWSSDGRFVLFSSLENDSDVPSRLWVLPVSGDGKPRRALSGNSQGLQGQFSPDGKWIAYVSGESGRLEVYVQPYPPGGGKWQISNQGGVQPRWRGDGKELFFIAPTGEVMAAQITQNPGFGAEQPRPLFNLHMSFTADRFQYAVTRDGGRFVAIVGEPSVTPLAVSTDFAVELPR
jgi:eukaryotic-like serine/threonine-protein kinase